MVAPDKDGSRTPSRGSSDEAIRTADLTGETLVKGEIAVAGTLKWEAPSAAVVAPLFSRLEITHLIGRGGMGAVYKGRHPGLDRWVAVKLLPAEISEDENFRKRFEREARTLARLNHPRIVTAYDFGTTDENHSYIVMEFVEGTDLHTLLQKGRLPPAEAIRLVRDICEALAYAHEQGVVHRDIKPANVLIDQNRRGKVADFGIARLNRRDTGMQGQTTQVVFGTPDYMAPEQFTARQVDHRTDIYSLGVIFYECLWGSLPEHPAQPIAHRLGIDKRVDKIIAKSRQSSPDARYQSASEMLVALQQIRVRPPTQGRLGVLRDQYLPEWSTAWWAATFALAILVVGALAFTLRPMPPTPGKKDTAISPMPAAATPVIPPPVERWHDWLAEEPLPGLLKNEAGEIVANPALGESPVMIPFGPPLRNHAARVKLTALRKLSGPIPVRLVRQSEDDPDVSYGVYRYRTAWMVNRSDPLGKLVGLCPGKPLPNVAGAEITLEFRCQNGRMSCFYNGEEASQKFACPIDLGRATMYLTKGVSVRRVEWLDLTR